MCEEVIQEAWNGGHDMTSGLAKTTAKLRQWNTETFGSFAKEMRGCQNQMSFLMREEQTQQVIDQMKAIDTRMGELEKREEVYWKQRSRQEWLKHGDKNTKFFHAKTHQRREQNSIESIVDAAAGNEFFEEDEISEIFVQHFDELFQANDDIDAAPILDKVCEKVPPSLKAMLEEPYVKAEVHEALKQMHPTKAPDPDGMCALFYQKLWSIVGVDVENIILDIFYNGGNVKALNHTHIALIPKNKKC